MYDNQQYKEL